MPRHRPQDHFGRKAKDEGFAARSVYKLREIDERVQLLRRGQRVLDLGASPGSWSQYASERVGDEGRVVGVDLAELRVTKPKNTVFLQHDVYALTPELLSEAGAPAEFDVVLSDMAPKTSGIKFRDQVMSFELFERALEVTRTFGRPETASFVCKIFMGPEFNQAIDLAKEHLKKTRVVRPSGVRSNSKEVFVVGQGLRAGGYGAEPSGVGGPSSAP
jgi:23S rRNA (uridine2552-2'-O)-methyltransferase